MELCPGPLCTPSFVKLMTSWYVWPFSALSLPLLSFQNAGVPRFLPITRCSLLTSLLPFCQAHRLCPPLADPGLCLLISCCAGWREREEAAYRERFKHIACVLLEQGCYDGRLFTGNLCCPPPLCQLEGEKNKLQNCHWCNNVTSLLGKTGSDFMPL